MPRSNSAMIHKLQQAINVNGGGPLMYNKTQFYSAQQDRPVTLYTVKKAIYDETRGRNSYKELFSSTSQIQIVLFLRDYWFEMNGWEVPTDNEKWNKAKEFYQQRQKKKARDRTLNEDEDNGWAEDGEPEIEKPKSLQKKR